MPFIQPTQRTHSSGIFEETKRGLLLDIADDLISSFEEVDEPDLHLWRDGHDSQTMGELGAVAKEFALDYLQFLALVPIPEEEIEIHHDLAKSDRSDGTIDRLFEAFLNKHGLTYDGPAFETFDT